MQGATVDEVKTKLGKTLHGADPLHSEEAVVMLLSDSGFEPPPALFLQLVWGLGLCAQGSDQRTPPADAKRPGTRPGLVSV
jgi:tRNA (cmo5U34)-methyltransferase